MPVRTHRQNSGPLGTEPPQGRLFSGPNERQAKNEIYELGRLLYILEKALPAPTFSLICSRSCREQYQEPAKGVGSMLRPRPLQERRADINHLKRNISILSIAERLGVTVRGNRALCFGGHDRNTWSLTFTPDKNLWYCHGCGKGGSNIDLVMAVLSLQFGKAVEWLSREYNSGTPASPSGTALRARARAGRLSDVERTHEHAHMVPDPEVYEWFVGRCSLGNRALSYLNGRGFTEGTIRHFGIVDLTDPRQVFQDAVRKWGLPRLMSSGLAVLRQDQRRGDQRASLLWWDYTILFPFVCGGRIRYIQGRRLSADGPKYIGLKGITKPMYNVHALSRLKHGETVLICEGLPDVLAAHQFGCVAVGIPGANSFRSEWTDSFLDFRVVVVPDMDTAGQRFGMKIRQSFAHCGKPVDVLRIEGAKDLAEYLSKSRERVASLQKGHC